MALNESKLPIKIRQARRARIFYYLIAIALAIVAFQLGGIFQLPLIIIASLFLITAEVIRFVNVIVVDRNKIVISSGIFSTHTISVYYDDITDIAVHQNLWERILGIGSISVNTPGHSEYELTEHNLSSPAKIREFIEKLEHSHALSRTAQKKSK